jgi:hypothetical protein
MTLRQFFEWVQEQPSVIIYYFAIILAITIIASLFAKEEGQLPPWNWLYAVIIYLVCIPGIFAVTLSVYFFLFEKRSIMDTELLLQVLPIAMMFIIVYIIRKNVDLKFIPGFEKLSSLMIIIGVILSLMWILDRTQLYAISFVPFYYVLIILIGGIFAMRMAFRKIMNQ